MKTHTTCYGLFLLLILNINVTAQASEQQASLNGNYSSLLQTIYCPDDVNDNGEFLDYGYWTGGVWCGQDGVAGYWVWSNPNWYIWQNSKAAESNTSGGTDKTTIYNYDGGGSYVGGKHCSYVSAGGTSFKVCD
jgi:hypothetical protein